MELSETLIRKDKQLIQTVLDNMKNRLGLSVKIESWNPLVAPNLRAVALLSIKVGHLELPFILEIKHSLQSKVQLHSLREIHSKTGMLFLITKIPRKIRVFFMIL